MLCSVVAASFDLGLCGLFAPVIRRYKRLIRLLLRDRRTRPALVLWMWCWGRLVLLGARSLSEHTQAMLSALCVLRDAKEDASKAKQIPDAMKLRSIFLSVKARVHTCTVCYVQGQAGLQ